MNLVYDYTFKKKKEIRKKRKEKSTCIHEKGFPKGKRATLIFSLSS
jgi:hypothetical protein